jgi:hypothetical protein
MSVLDVTFGSASIHLKEPLVSSELITNNTFNEASSENNILTTSL